MRLHIIVTAGIIMLTCPALLPQSAERVIAAVGNDNFPQTTERVIAAVGNDNFPRSAERVNAAVENDNLPQSAERVTAEIEKNNTTLIALRQEAEAQRIGSRTGLAPANPEFGFDYLWGAPEEIGHKIDVSLVQSFDFPTAYAYRNRIAGMRERQAGLAYERGYHEIITRARQLCNELAFHNALQAELERRVEHARGVAESYRRLYESGGAGIIDYNKARVHLLNMTRDAEANAVEAAALLTELAALNGGTPLEYTDTVYLSPGVSPDFEEWYARAEASNPELLWLREEVAASRGGEQLSLAMSLPKLHAGYMSEKLISEHFQGVTVGITIPLFENRNEVKYAKAKRLAAESSEADGRIQFYNGLKALHAKAAGLQRSLDDYRRGLEQYSNAALLQRALDGGEISLAEYFLELTVYYESADRLLAMGKSLNETIIELNRYE